jgi:FkbM family methyltransferase
MFSSITARATPRPFNPFEQELPGSFAVFGTGQRGRRCRQRLEAMSIRVECFVDNNPCRQATVVDGLPVVSPDALLARSPDIPILICSFARQEIFAQLAAMGFRDLYHDGLAERPPLRLLRERARDFEQVLASLADDDSRRMYADVLRFRFYGTPIDALSPYPMYAHPQVRVQAGDAVIDGGAASGDTLALFLEAAGSTGRIHCFEPTPESFAHLQACADGLGCAGVHPVQAALWNQNGQVRFFESFAMSHGNRIGQGGQQEGGVQVEAVTLDSFVERAGIDRLDLIKLDIEGAELAALQGARETIRRFRPKLQICLYHQSQDLWELPLFVRELVPEYRLYVGHHSPDHLDTVLYCRV